MDKLIIEVESPLKGKRVSLFQTDKYYKITTQDQVNNDLQNVCFINNIEALTKFNEKMTEVL